MKPEVNYERKGGMNYISASTIINDKPTAIWEVLKQLDKAHNWNPLIKHATTKGQTDTLTRHCDLVPMGSIEERVLEWKEGQKIVLDVYDEKGVPPLKKMTGTFILEEVSQGTKLTVSFVYGLKMGLLGKFIDAVMVRPQFIKGPPTTAYALKHYVETGKKVTKSELKKMGI